MVMKPHKVTKFTIFVMGGWRVDVVLNILIKRINRMCHEKYCNLTVA